MSWFRRTLLSLALFLGMYANDLHAYPTYNNNVPNGNSIPPSTIALGHPGGATKRYTAFANSYVADGRKWTLALCKADSDNDGQSNGLEIGDPCCTWMVGSAPLFQDGLSDPNDPASKTKNTNQTCQ